MQSYEKRLIYESGVRFFYINFIFFYCELIVYL